MMKSETLSAPFRRAVKRLRPRRKDSIRLQLAQRSEIEDLRAEAERLLALAALVDVLRLHAGSRRWMWERPLPSTADGLLACDHVERAELLVQRDRPVEVGDGDQGGTYRPRLLRRGQRAWCFPPRVLAFRVSATSPSVGRRAARGRRGHTADAELGQGGRGLADQLVLAVAVGQRHRQVHQLLAVLLALGGDDDLGGEHLVGPGLAGEADLVRA